MPRKEVPATAYLLRWEGAVRSDRQNEFEAFIEDAQPLHGVCF